MASWPGWDVGMPLGRLLLPVLEAPEGRDMLGWCPGHPPDATSAAASAPGSTQSSTASVMGRWLAAAWSSG